jgi:GT2 family glycosyltransferase
MPEALPTDREPTQEPFQEPFQFEASLVLPVHNEGRRLAETLAAIRDTTGVRYEAIVVNDASTDACCDCLRADPPPFANVVLIDLAQRHGVAPARNLGAERARAPVLVFMDAHVVPRRGWLEGLLEELDQHEGGIVAPQISSLEDASATTFGLTIRDRELGVGWLDRRGDEPYPVPLAGCACMVMTRAFFESVGQFDAMRSYGMEDVEMCIRAWLLGYSVIMVPKVEVAHLFKKTPFTPAWHDYVYNRLRTAVLHFEGERLERILKTLATKPAFADAAGTLLLLDIWPQYSRLRAKRVHDADWFCRKFEIAL